MRIQCEKCRTLFNLDETLLKEGGSHVKCSLCGHLFKAYPPEHTMARAIVDAPASPPQDDMDMSETLTPKDSGPPPPPFQGKDDAFEADLDSVYKDAFEGPDFGLAQTDEPVSEDLGNGKEDEIKEDTTENHVGEAPDPTETTAKPASAKRKAPKGARFTILLVAFLILLGVVGGVTYWKPDWIPPSLSFLNWRTPEKKKPADAGVRLLQFESVAGSFVDSEKGGHLFVIRGMVRNNYPTPRSYLLVKGTILDDKGKVVETKVGYAGNTFTEEELKTLPLEEIKKAMRNRDGMARQNFNLSSGAGVPFMIVFEDLPENLSEFSVEAVSSLPGS